MKEIAIIGAGQLGSRHLQGVLKSNYDFQITVVDPNQMSLDVAKNRAAEINHAHDLVFSRTISDLAGELELVIIATNADVRLKVLLELLNHAKVTSIVLEKVLFQRVEDYDIALTVLIEHQVRCYVNHPRRMQELYKDLKGIITAHHDEPFTIQAYGANWGLGCNGLHISDVITYLLDDKVMEYCNEELDEVLINSKREGFKEFTGCIKGTTKGGHQFTISSIKTEDGRTTPISINILSPQVRISIFEKSAPQVALIDLESQPQSEILNVKPMLFQSDLSTNLVDDTLENKPLNLTSYEEAMENHVLFIQSLNKHIEKITGEKIDECPIT